MSKDRNLAVIYEEFFTALVRFGAQPTSVDAERFRRNMIGLLDQARSSTQKRYADTDVKMADLVASALLDETVLKAARMVDHFQGWSSVHAERFPQLGQFAGEQVFKNIDALLDRPDGSDVADISELHLLCMLLGFEGAFGVSELHMRQKLRRDSLEQYREATYAHLQRIRERQPMRVPAVSNLTPRPAKLQDQWTVPLLLTTAVAFAILAVLFIWFRISLAAAVGSVKG